MNGALPVNGRCPMCKAPVDDHVRGGIDLRSGSHEIRICPQAYWLNQVIARRTEVMYRWAWRIASYGTLLAFGIWLGRHREEVLAFLRSLP